MTQKAKIDTTAVAEHPPEFYRVERHADLFDSLEKRRRAARSGTRTPGYSACGACSARGTCRTPSTRSTT